MVRQKATCDVPKCKSVAWGIGIQLYCLRHTQEIISEKLVVRNV